MNDTRKLTDHSWWLAPLAVLIVGCIITAIHSSIAYGSKYSLAGVLLAASCGAVGIFLGFLFGIPRALSSGDTGSQGSTSRSARPQYATNTNLEQISDWLTKAIVAIGLVEARDIAHWASEGAKQIAPFVSSDENGKGFVLVTGCLFVVIGFIGGYLWTRVFLTQEFRKADDEALETPEYYEGLMHAYLYRTPNGYLSTLRVADEFKAAYGENFTGQMCLYLACAYAQSYANLINKSGADAAREASTAKSEMLKYAELAMKLETENKGLIRQLWRPGQDDDPKGDFVVFKNDKEFETLMEKFIGEKAKIP